jgi:hypothetical protein
MEHLVLKVLEFDLSVPTAHLFVNKMCQMIPTEDKVRTGMHIEGTVREPQHAFPLNLIIAMVPSFNVSFL